MVSTFKVFALYTRSRPSPLDRWWTTHPHEFNKGVVYTRAMGQEEAASGTHIVKEKQFLIFSDSAMVALRGFGKEDLVIGQLFLVGE